MATGDKLAIFISDPGSLLTDHLSHGDGLTAWGFVSHLAARGHTVHVAASRVSCSQEPPEGLSIHRYTLAAPLPALEPLQAMIQIRRIFRRMRSKVRFDLSHQLNPVREGLTGLLLKEGLPIVLGPFVPRLVASSSSRFRSPYEAIGRWVRDFLVGRFAIAQERSAAALLLSSPAALRALQEPEARAHKTTLLSTGVDTNLFSPVADGHREIAKEPSILFLANLHARKGIYTLLEAFQRVNEVIPNCHLYIAGGGPESQNLQARIAEIRCGQMITLLGSVEQHRVPEVMRSCTVYCLPSYGEPFCLSALEAMACGKPLVVTNALGLGYLIDDPEGGRKVSPRDPIALATALIELLTSPQQCESMGAYNRKQALEKFDWDVVVRKLEAVYAKVLSGAS